MDTVREADDPIKSPIAEDTLLMSMKMLSELKKSRRKTKLSSCSKREFDLTSMDDVSGFHAESLSKYDQNTINRPSMMPKLSEEIELKMVQSSSESYEIPSEKSNFQSPLKKRMFNYGKNSSIQKQEYSSPSISRLTGTIPNELTEYYETPKKWTVQKVEQQDTPVVGLCNDNFLQTCPNLLI